MSALGRKILNGILSTNVSGLAVIFTAIYSFNQLRFHSSRTFGHFGYRMASIGLCMVVCDAVNAMVYKTKYPIESFFPLDNERPPENASLIFFGADIVCSDAVACLTCALYAHHKIPCCGLLQLVVVKFVKEIHWLFKNLLRPKCQFWRIPFVEFYLSANMIVFGMTTNNFHSVVAAASYQVVSLVNKPCAFYAHTNLRVLQNYAMIPYLVSITGALCT